MPADAYYPVGQVDSQGRPLTGAHNYVMHFAKGGTPPVNGFWSLTMYNKEYFLVPNATNRYALSGRDPLKYNDDGSLDLYIQKDVSESGKVSNWLAAPEGDFLLLYWPKETQSQRDKSNLFMVRFSLGRRVREDTSAEKSRPNTGDWARSGRLYATKCPVLD